MATPAKRGKYKRYLYDDKIPIPRQTLHCREKKALSNVVIAEEQVRDTTNNIVFSKCDQQSAINLNNDNVSLIQEIEVL